MRQVSGFTAAAAAFGLLLAACGGAAPPTSSSPPLPASVSAIPAAQASASKAGAAIPGLASSAPSSSTAPQTFTNQNWGMVTPDPARYQGAAVTLTGQVFNVEEDQSREGIQIWADPQRAAGNTVVIFSRQGFPEVHKNDQVEIQGTIVGVFTGKNDSGEMLKLPKVQATSVQVLSRASAAPIASVQAATATPPPSASPTAASLGAFIVSGSEPTGLAVRTAPGVRNTKLGVVHDGGRLSETAESSIPGWIQVQGDGFSGYVWRAYLKPASGVGALAKLSPK